MMTTEPIRSKHEITELVEYYLKRGQIRNHVLIVMAVYTALRTSDLLQLRWDDVYDFAYRNIRKRIILAEKKTGKTKTIAPHAEVVAALKLYVGTAESGAFLFSNPQTGEALSRTQVYRIICYAAKALGFPTRVSGHSLRKTFGYHAWKDGKKPEIIMKVYNHSSLAITSRYLGITQDDIDAVYLDANLRV